MKKCASLFLIIFFASICHGQIKAFRDASIRRDFTVLVGPENVDRFYPGQSDDYINQYYELKELIIIELSRAESKFFALENKKVRNKSKMDRYGSKIDACYEGLELLEYFISCWLTHEEKYKEAQDILNAKSDSLKCFSLASKDKTFQLQDFLHC